MSEPIPINIDPAREKLLAAVDAAQRLLDEARQLLLRSPIEQGDVTALSAEPEWVPAWGKLGDAEKLLKCSRATALRKIRLHGLGHVVDRRWQVDLRRCDALLAKQPFPPLTGSN